MTRQTGFFASPVLQGFVMVYGCVAALMIWMLSSHPERFSQPGWWTGFGLGAAAAAAWMSSNIVRSVISAAGVLLLVKLAFVPDALVSGEAVKVLFHGVSLGFPAILVGAGMVYRRRIHEKLAGFCELADDDVGRRWLETHRF